MQKLHSNPPETKLARLKTALAKGDSVGALRIAARFPQLGDEKEPITRAWAAYNNPDFYRSIGQNPLALIDAGIDAIKRRYNLS